MIKKNDVVQFTENHKWVGCFGYVNEVRNLGGRMRYMIGVPLPMQGTAYIFDDGFGIEKVGTAVLVPAENEDGERRAGMKVKFYPDGIESDVCEVPDDISEDELNDMACEWVADNVAGFWEEV